jgi:hypothetical protein
MGLEQDLEPKVVELYLRVVVPKAEKNFPLNTI